MGGAVAVTRLTAGGPRHAGCMRWATAQRSLERSSGDAFLALEHGDGTLLAVVDGLGHGAPAARASQRAVERMRARAADPPLALLRACDEALRQTRGAVLTLAQVHESGRLAWVGVGNVVAALFPPEPASAVRWLVLPGGIAGRSLPPVRVSEERLRAGAALVFATDGVDPDAIGAYDRRASLDENARRILEHGDAGRDDALVLVARYDGGPSQ